MPILADGAGGDLTLEAGRSVFFNADIFTDGGSLTAIANRALAAGPVDGERDPGAADIDARFANLDLGDGQLLLQIESDPTKVDNTTGDIVVGNITAGTVDIFNDGPGSIELQGDDVLATGDITVNGLGSLFLTNADPQGYSTSIPWAGRSTSPRPAQRLSATWWQVGASRCKPQTSSARSPRYRSCRCSRTAPTSN